MEISLGVIVTAIIFIVTQLIASVIWAIRLEGRLDNKREAIQRIEKSVSEIEDTLYRHLMDSKGHYNEQFFNEFRSALDNKFSDLRTQLSTINAKIDTLGHK